MSKYITLPAACRILKTYREEFNNYFLREYKIKIALLYGYSMDKFQIIIPLIEIERIRQDERYKLFLQAKEVSHEKERKRILKRIHKNSK